MKLTLNMNVANFKVGQVNVNEQIQKVIGKCFSIMDHTLNLENFSNNLELSQIEIKLKYPAILANVLLQSARRLLSNVHKLKLNDNGLTSGNGTRPLTWMKCLTSIDLSNNNVRLIQSIFFSPFKFKYL